MPGMHQDSADSLDAALANLLARFRADSGTIHLLGADGALHLAASAGIPPVVQDAVRLVPVGKGMAGLAAERLEPVTTCNLQTDATGDVRLGARATGLQGAIAVPMLEEGRLAGVIGIGNRGERTFTAEEIAGLMEVGRLLAKPAH